MARACGAGCSAVDVSSGSCSAHCASLISPRINPGCLQEVRQRSAALRDASEFQASGVLEEGCESSPTEFLTTRTVTR